MAAEHSRRRGISSRRHRRPSCLHCSYFAGADGRVIKEAPSRKHGFLRPRREKAYRERRHGEVAGALAIGRGWRHGARRVGLMLLYGVVRFVWRGNEASRIVSAAVSAEHTWRASVYRNARTRARKKRAA